MEVDAVLPPCGTNEVPVERVGPEALLTGMAREQGLVPSTDFTADSDEVAYFGLVRLASLGLGKGEGGVILEVVLVEVVVAKGIKNKVVLVDRCKVDDRCEVDGRAGKGSSRSWILVWGYRFCA